MPEVAESIKDLLGLQAELGPALRDQVRSGCETLLTLNDAFKKHCSDMQIWTFYETVDSAIKCRPSAASWPEPDSSAEPGGRRRNSSSRPEFSFSGFVTPVRFAILGTRQEKIFPLQTDHAGCASIGGRKNARTKKSFLEDLGAHIRKAAQLSDKHHHELELYRSVKVEVHGYYQDAPGKKAAADAHVAIRPWSNRVPLERFLQNGPQKCLDEGITMRSPKPGSPLFHMRLHSSEPNMHGAYIADGTMVGLGLGLADDVRDDLERIADAERAALAEQLPRHSDSAVGRPLSLGLQQRSLPPKSDQRFMEVLARPLDAALMRRASTRRQSVGAASVDGSEDAAADRTTERWRQMRSDDTARRSRRIKSRHRTRWDQTPGGLGAPDPQAQKYMWIHMASNNPTWVEVRTSWRV